jgi:hypothetical protein
MDWDSVAEDNLRKETLAKVLHPDLPAAWEARWSVFIVICHDCKCQIPAGDRYYWHAAQWLAYHPTCVDAAVVRRDV